MMMDLATHKLRDAGQLACAAQSPSRHRFEMQYRIPYGVVGGGEETGGAVAMLGGGFME